MAEKDKDNPRDVRNHNNPNGITTAEISAKLPKAGGENETVATDDGRYLDRRIDADPTLATAAGGVEGAEKGVTPGPAPETSDQRLGQTAGAMAVDPKEPDAKKAQPEVTRTAAPTEKSTRKVASKKSKK